MTDKSKIGDEEEKWEIFETLLEMWDSDKLIEFMKKQYILGYDQGYIKGREDYRDALLEGMDAARAKIIEGLVPHRLTTQSGSIVKSIEEVRKPAEPEPNPPSAPKSIDQSPAPKRSHKKGRPVDHPPRPIGIPTTFAMIREVLLAEPGLQAKAVVDRIAEKWWPGLQFAFMAPDISTAVTGARLVRDSEGRLTVTEKGQKSNSIDQRGMTNAGTQPPQVPQPREPAKEPIGPPPAPRTVVTPGTKLGPPTRQEGVKFQHGDNTAILHEREAQIAGQLRSAMGKGHLDAKFLANSIGIKSEAESTMRDFVSILNPKIASLGLTVDFYRGFGFIMKECAVGQAF